MMILKRINGAAKMITLVTGGSRSGKSRHALKLAEAARRPCFVATGWAGDDEMKVRIEKHQKERGPHWSTIEEKTDLVRALAKAVAAKADFIVVDCLTLWVSNLMMEGGDVGAAVGALTENLPGVDTVFVTNEVGMGVVPEHRLGREFRDLAGMVNQRMAAAADKVVLTVCGIPMAIK